MATPKESFAVDAAAGASFGFVSTAVLLPGTTVGSDAMVRIANIGPAPIAVKLGTSAAVSVTSSTGVVIMPGQVEFLTLAGGTTYIAGVACGGPGQASTVNLATGS